MEKKWKSYKLGKIGVPSDSELLWWEKIGKVVNQAKLAIPGDSEKRLEKL